MRKSHAEKSNCWPNLMWSLLRSRTYSRRSTCTVSTIFRSGMHWSFSLLGSPKDQCIPERKIVETVQVDRREYVRDLRSDHIKFGQQFDFSACDLRIDG